MYSSPYQVDHWKQTASVFLIYSFNANALGLILPGYERSPVCLLCYSHLSDFGESKGFNLCGSVFETGPAHPFLQKREAFAK